MRLLHTRDLRVQDFAPSEAPRSYAILSHTWEEEEVTLQHMEKGDASTMKGYQKLRSSCQRAMKDGYDWIWIDTCCIDKTSSAELGEAINSMFTYYGHSAVCYAYLADIENPEGFGKSRWFTRGWTLQELLAPRHLIFFDKSWRELGTKQFFSKRISSGTGIPEEAILGTSVRTYNAAQRMSWASRRQTTRAEDIAYCLLGLFDIHMFPIYGEGTERAYIRLQEEILRQSEDHTLFLWTPKHDPYNQGLLASSPEAFCTHPECFTWMPQELCESQPTFDPYMYLIRQPSNVSKYLFKLDTKTYRTGLIPTEHQEFRTPASPSLGPTGLQISLLSNIRDESEDSRVMGTELKIIMFDVLLHGPDFRAPIHLYLRRERAPEHQDGFVPHRLGVWRRPTYSELQTSYFTKAPPFSFQRVPVAVSQVEAIVPYSGHDLNFVVSGNQSEELIDCVLLVDSDGSLKNISNPREPFKCRAGVVVLQHSCVQCDMQIKAVLYFGGHGTVYQPWCYLTHLTPPGKYEPSREDLFERHDLVSRESARFGPRSSWHMSCNVEMKVQIDLKSDQDFYFIMVSSAKKEVYHVQ
ncbi:hypothetical protein PV08_03760 [Exophiala spinifera]|uniref:Heterokaryon incompatibility domain-containing protein n=1 Tax=Exophiala spinifera TaxID=91928 RepID=A0A0D1ZV32_9EURO|nr:uncharacterized protein PV08_03760 [Exophiala spinifera]KIW16572.1 hypothetical protein PV08_03760 [Exophiala spinifera]